MKKVDKKFLWEENFPVFSFQCDRNNKIRLTSLAQFFQELAWRHADYCGVGYKGLYEKNFLWILSGLKIKVIDYPKWEDHMKIFTWGKEYVNLFAFREFEILNSKSEPVVLGSSSWIVADAETHRPLRITDDLLQVPPFSKDVDLDRPGKITIDKEYKNFFDVHVTGSDIDVYDHVNNTKYIEWCLDAVPEIHTEKLNLTGFDIRFIHEAKFNEDIRIYYNLNAENITYRGINQNTKAEVFRAQALISKL